MIDFSGVSKYFGGEPILKDVSFRVDPGERVGVVGPNGAGKSTLFNLISGELSPDGGTVAMPKDWQLGIMRQQLPDAENAGTLLDFTADAVPELKAWTAELQTLDERLATGESTAQMLDRYGVLQSKIEHAGAYRLHVDAEKALCNLGFAPEELNRPLKSFSGGWQMRAALARVLVADPDILLLDEPSNYLDIPAVEYLCKFLNSYRGTLLLISHDRFLLRKLTEVTLEVNGGRVVRYAGGYDYYRRERVERKRSLEAAKRNTERKKEHLEKIIDRFRAKAAKAAQAKSWQKALDRIEDIDLPDELDYSGAIRFPEPPPCGALAAEFENVSFSYDGKKEILRNVNLHIDSGDKIAFVGFNGMGKTTLLKLLGGYLKPSAGKITLGHHVVIGYQAQEFGDILCDGQSAYDTVRAALPAGVNSNVLPNVLGSFGFSGDAMHKLCGVLSGGEKIRLCLARIFVNPPNLLILDEPTTHLDVHARELLQEALRKFKGTVCMVSHDIEFVRNTAAVIVEVKRPDAVKFFGNYDYYLEKVSGNIPGGSDSAGEKTASAAAGKKSMANSGKNEKNGTSAGKTPPKKSSAAQSAAVSSEDSAKAKRQERARLRNLLAGDKKRIDAKVKKLEERSAALEEKIEELTAAMASGERIDFASAGRELSGAQAELELVLKEWEDAAWEQQRLYRELEAIAQEVK